MIWVDYCIVVVFLVSTLIGIFRGFTREVLGVLTWVLALALPYLFGETLAEAIATEISTPPLRLAAAYAALFMGGLLLGGLVTWIVSERVDHSGFKGTDRALGGGLGCLLAAVITAGFVLVADTMGAREDRWWKESLLVQRFDWLAQGLRAVVPDSWLAPLQPASPPSPVTAEQKVS